MLTTIIFVLNIAWYRWPHFLYCRCRSSLNNLKHVFIKLANTKCHIF